MAKKRITVSVNQYGQDMEISTPRHWAEEGQEVTITVCRFGHEFRMLSYVRGAGYWRKVTAHQDILRDIGVQDGDRVVILKGPIRPDILFVGRSGGKHLLRVTTVARELELGGGEGLYHVETRQLTVRGREVLERVTPKVRHAFGIKEGWRIEVDEQGLNAGERYFDIFVNGKGGIVWLGEVKSRWRMVSDPNLQLSSALSEAMPATTRRVRDVRGKVEIVPSLGYAIGMYIAEDEVLIRWRTVDITSSADSPLAATKDQLTELQSRKRAPTQG